jgi:hypothetical protein
MPLVGFEPTIPVFERAKMFHALDRAAIVIVKIFTVLKFVDHIECICASPYFQK